MSLRTVTYVENLTICWKTRVSESTPCVRSDNLFGAGNQQETAVIIMKNADKPKVTLVQLDGDRPSSSRFRIELTAGGETLEGTSSVSYTGAEQKLAGAALMRVRAQKVAQVL